LRAAGAGLVLGVLGAGIGDRRPEDAETGAGRAIADHLRACLCRTVPNRLTNTNSGWRLSGVSVGAVITANGDGQNGNAIFECLKIALETVNVTLNNRKGSRHGCDVFIGARLYRWVL
jgi:hypothetical protein